MSRTQRQPVNGARLGGKEIPPRLTWSCRGMMHNGQTDRPRLASPSAPHFTSLSLSFYLSLSVSLVFRSIYNSTSRSSPGQSLIKKFISSVTPTRRLGRIKYFYLTLWSTLVTRCKRLKRPLFRQSMVDDDELGSSCDFYCEIIRSLIRNRTRSRIIIIRQRLAVNDIIEKHRDVAFISRYSALHCRNE